VKRTVARSRSPVAERRVARSVSARRARFAALLHRLVGMSIEQAERLFRPLIPDGAVPQTSPASRRRRRKGIYRIAP
jgi:hypothetical protein